jgi:CheY-like chemotaxis protein
MTDLQPADRFRVFCATWSEFNVESSFPVLSQTGAGAVALGTALQGIDALADDCVHLHGLDGATCFTAVDDFLERRDEDVILYFASHGLVPSGANQYFRLAAADTRDAGDMTRALVMAEVIDRLGRSPAKRKLLIIDACYAGKAATALLANGSVDLELADEMCVLFATNPFTQAIAPPGDSLTDFSGRLVELLARGLPGAGPRFSMTAAYEALKRQAEAGGPPAPWMIATGNAADQITFPNQAHQPATKGQQPPSAEERGSDDHAANILYIDDERRPRRDFKEQLEGAGHRVTLADGPIEGQRAIKATHFDIVVIDLLLKGDAPATEFIKLCGAQARDSRIFLVSRQTQGSEDLWDRLDAIFPYPIRVSAFLWKPDYITTVIQHANTIKATRVNVLSHVHGLQDCVPLVAGRMINRNEELSDQSERLQLELRTCVERLVARWFPAQDEERVYVESMTLTPIDSGRSSSAVFTLLPSIRGIDADRVTPLVLKLGPRAEIKEEVRRYDRYVQVGVPLDLRTDKIGSALVGNVGGVIYSFRGSDDNAPIEVGQLDPEEIAKCLDIVFKPGSGKRWYASHATGEGVMPIEHFKGLGFGRERFRGATRHLNASLDRTLRDLPPGAPERAEKVEGVFEDAMGNHPSTLVHGDLTLGNLVRIDEGRFAIIDYRTVGIGPRLIDFATLEIACWLLAHAPDGTRLEHFVEARQAVFPELHDVRSEEEVAPWLRDSWRLAKRCRTLAVANHSSATTNEYGSLLWFSAVRASAFRSRVRTKRERNAQRAVLPALALAAQAMIELGDPA